MADALSFDDVETTNPAEVLESIPSESTLLSPDKKNDSKLLERMTPYEKQGDEMLAKIKAFEIKDGTDSSILYASLKTINALLTDVEAIRKIVQKPYADQVKAIMNFAKKITESLNEAKKIAKDKLVAEETRIQDKKNKEILKVNQICTAVRNSPDKKSLDEKIEKIEAEGYIDNSDVLLAISEMIQKFESDTKVEDDAKLREQEDARLQSLTDNPIGYAEAAEEINKAREERQDAFHESQKRAEEQKQELIANKHETNQMLADDAKLNKTKGVRKKLTFEVLDASKVPAQFCSPDDAKIAEHIKNTVNLKLDSIPGVRIFEQISVQ